MSFRLPVLILCLALVSQAADIKGKVTNAIGEPLGRVQVFVLETKASAVTTTSGDFEISPLKPGHYTLRLNAVGYRLLTVPFDLEHASDQKDFSITMVPDNFQRTDKVEVHGDIFQRSDSPATNELNLNASEIRQTSTVFADDPFRAVQTIPGVSAEGNNEFFAQFSVMGAPFSSVSIYIDDVLVQNPFHQIGNFVEGASLGVLTSEVVEEMKLLPAAYPQEYGDADGAALEVRTREGSRERPMFRISAGIAATEALGEGSLGHSRKGSWLVSARKSYINYLLKNRVQDAADIGFEDADLKLNYDLTSHQNVDLFVTDGHTNMMMNNPAALTISEYANGKSDFTLARAGWRWSINPRLLVEAHGAYIREPVQLFNTSNVALAKNDHREFVGGVGLTWAWSPDHILQAGFAERHVYDVQDSSSYDNNGALITTSLAASGLRQDGYVQQSSSFLHGRVHAVGSLRWDSLTGFDLHPVSPQLSVAIQAARATQIQLATGRYQQFFSRLEIPGTTCSPFGFMPTRSDHYSAAIEQRIGENTRFRVEAFERRDASAFGAIPNFAGQGIPLNSCPSLEPLSNSTYDHDYSRGVQFVLQRRSANRLSGWVGYTLARARQKQSEVFYSIPPAAPAVLFPNNTPYYPTLEDQRHTVNAFAMYRLTPSLSMSTKWLYGSGFPVPSGVYIQVSNGQFVPVGLNATQLGAYQRLDIRADKDWAFQHWKLTLYGEVLNLTNHYNGRFAYESGIDPTTGQAQVKTLQGLPITPTAGLVFQF